MIGKEVLYFFLRSFGFAIVLCLTWFLVFNPKYGLQKYTSTTAELQERQQAEKYDLQLAEANRQLGEAAAQQKRMDALLTKYEQQAIRYDVILEKWDRSGKVGP